MSAFICSITFYNKKHERLKTISTIDATLCANSSNLHLLETPNEYYITLEFITPPTHTSYIDVYSETTFISRHYFRDGKITPFVSFEQNKTLDPFISKEQISAVPRLNWNKIKSEHFWNGPDSKLMNENPYHWLIKHGK